MIKVLIKLFLLMIIFLLICAGSSVLPHEKENVLKHGLLDGFSYKWIEHDKIRAGYLFFNDPVSKIKLLKELGLNTIILGCYRFEYPTLREETICKMKEWAKTAKNNDIHLFFAINWQPFPGTKGHQYSFVAYEDGTKGVAVCPLDKKFWTDRIKDIFMLIADMSSEPNLQVDGIFLDMEIYGSEKEPQVKRSYYEPKCDYSDVCFSEYLINRGYKHGEFPSVELKDRKDWLANKKLLDDYFFFLRDQIKIKAEQLRNALHNVNPNLLIGMYPHPLQDDFVQYSLAQGFSSQTLPFIVFGTHAYGYKVDKNGDGYTLIPKDLKIRYQKEGINILYSAGYLFKRYNGETLERNLKQSVKNWDGYWLFNLRQLWKTEDNPDKLFQLKDSVENLEKAIGRSNNMRN